jgi:hypothetical protein
MESHGNHIGVLGRDVCHELKDSELGDTVSTQDGENLVCSARSQGYDLGGRLWRRKSREKTLRDKKCAAEVEGLSYVTCGAHAGLATLANSSHHICWSTTETGAMALNIPAFFTSISAWPYFSFTFSKSDLTDPGSAMSVGTTSVSTTRVGLADIGRHLFKLVSITGDEHDCFRAGSCEARYKSLVFMLDDGEVTQESAIPELLGFDLRQ